MVYFGISGCGGFIEKAVLPMMQRVKNAKVVAAFDVNKQQLDKVCRKFNISQRCTTFEKLLESNDVDAIYIATPNVFHKRQTIAAAMAGKHVFCQKPLGMNAAECREMIKVCRDMGVKLGVGFCYRFQGAQQQVKKLIKKGVIGEVSYISFSFNLGDYNPETVGWRCNPKMSGGGPLMDLAPHLIDLACYFLEDRVESVMAYVRPQKTKFKIETDVLAIMEFSKGPRVSMDISFVRKNVHNYTVVGSKGQIHAVGTMPWRTGGKLTLQLKKDEQDVPFSKTEHIEEEIRLYCSAIEKGAEPRVTGEAGLYAQAVIDAIYESGRTGLRYKVRY